MVDPLAGGALKSDRAGRESVYVQHPVVALTGGIQPDVLPTLAGDVRQRDGFMERFLFADPDTKPMGWTSETVAEATTEKLTAVYEAILGAGYTERETVDLSDEARTRFACWNNDLARRMTHVGVRCFYAKLRQVPPPSVLHCLEHGGRRGRSPSPSAPSTRRLTSGTTSCATPSGCWPGWTRPAWWGRRSPPASIGRSARQKGPRSPSATSTGPLAGALKASIWPRPGGAGASRLDRGGDGQAGRRWAPRPRRTGCEQMNLMNRPPRARTGRGCSDACDECGAPVEAFTATGARSA